MEELIHNFSKIDVNNHNLLYNIKKYIDFIHDKNQYTNKEKIIIQDNYWKNVNPMTLENLTDYINETLNDEQNNIMNYLKMNHREYKYNILMFLDYIIHTVFN